MDRPSSGQLHYGDRQLDRLSEKQLSQLRRREFGYVFQQIHLIANLSLFENTAVAGYLTMPAAKAHHRAEELLAEIGLDAGLGRRLPTQVSGGQAQRVAVARALMNSPKLLFADEPTGALNSSAGREILDLLTSLNHDGQTIIMVTHDVKAASRGNRLLYLKDGVIGSELKLPGYDAERADGREPQVIAWLSSLGW
jgi:putative ABC transport system ATP-binding protein